MYTNVQANLTCFFFLRFLSLSQSYEIPIIFLCLKPSLSCYIFAHIFASLISSLMPIGRHWPAYKCHTHLTVLSISLLGKNWRYPPKLKRGKLRCIRPPQSQSGPNKFLKTLVCPDGLQHLHETNRINNTPPPLSTKCG